MSRATIFDFNGVLVDDESVHLAAFRDVLSPLGVTFDDHAYEEKYLGFDDAGAFRAILQDAGRSPSDAEVRALIEAKKPVYMSRIADSLVVFAGAREIVQRRAARSVVGIVSGALRAEIEHCLAVMGVRDAVSFIVSAEDTKRSKPDPEGYVLGIAALAATHGHAADAVVIEDSLAGVAAAKSAKLRCAAVTHSYSAARLRSAGADVVAASLDELTDAVLDGP